METKFIFNNFKYLGDFSWQYQNGGRQNQKLQKDELTKKQWPRTFQAVRNAEKRSFLIRHARSAGPIKVGMF